MFKLNIGTVTKTIDEYDKKINILAEIRGNINNTITELTELGWSGEARDKFIEYHQRNIAKYEQLEEQLKYMKSVLENDLKPKAVQLKKRSEDFVNCIKRSESGGALSSDNEGVIILEGSQFQINNNVINCTSNYYPTMQRKFQEIMDLVGRLEYTSFGISGDIWNAETSLRNQTTSLTDFDDSFNVYCNDVQSMESNICSLFGKVSGVSNISAFNSSSVISSSGEIDKNKVEQLMLKNQDDLTDEEKEELNYIMNVYDDDELKTLVDELSEKKEANVDSTDGENGTVDNSLLAMLSRTYNLSNGIGDDSTGLIANSIETGSVAIKNYNMAKYTQIAKENGMGQSYKWLNSKLSENTAIWGYSGGIAECASKIGKATPYITIACDVYSDLESTDLTVEQKACKTTADATVDFVLYGGSAVIADMAATAAVGAVGGPPGMLIGAAVGLGVGILSSVAIDGYSAGKDERGNDVSIKQFAEKKLSEGIDYAGKSIASWF